jgi:MFS superfamily sulfate permease-like transporter
MQLGVGPVALISLLMGELLGMYGIDAIEEPNRAINFAAQACFCSGLLMVVMGLFNLGNLIRFISHPGILYTTFICGYGTNTLHMCICMVLIRFTTR